jgi:hypothetical protein
MEVGNAINRIVAEKAERSGTPTTHETRTPLLPQYPVLSTHFNHSGVVKAERMS